MIPDKASADLLEMLHCRYGRMLALRNDQYIGAALRDYGEYSESEVALWRQLLKPDAIVVDAGANCGAHTVALAQMVPRGAVLAFEPMRYMYHILCGNLALNGLTNVLAHNAAVGAKAGSITVPAIDFTLERENYGGMDLRRYDVGNQVPLVALDDIMPRVDFIKADVEGMEGDLLKGAARLIQQCRPVLYLENNPEGDQQPLIDQVHALGYDCWWHWAPHYNPANYRGNTEDHYPNVVSYNMICLPSHPDNQITGFEPIPRREGVA